MVDLAVVEAEEKWLSLGFEKVAKLVMYLPEEVIERHDRAHRCTVGSKSRRQGSFRSCTFLTSGMFAFVPCILGHAHSTCISELREIGRGLVHIRRFVLFVYMPNGSPY